MGNDKAFVAYYRVSTDKQGRSGHGLEAQRQAVERFIDGTGSKIVARFEEVESGRNSERPELEAAIRRTRAHGARLVVAKLDRLSRDAAFILGRLRDEKVDFICADMPQADRLNIGIVAVVAEREAQLISKRTKEGLAVARAEGKELGKPENLKDAGRAEGRKESARIRSERADRRARDLADVVEELREEGASSLREIAAGLDGRGITTPRGAAWTATGVKRVLDRLESLTEVRET